MYGPVFGFAALGAGCGLAALLGGSAAPGASVVASLFPGAAFGVVTAAAWRREGTTLPALLLRLVPLATLAGLFAVVGYAVSTGAYAGLVVVAGPVLALAAVGFACSAACSAAWRVFTAGVPRVADATGLEISWPPREVWALAVLGSVLTGLFAVDRVTGAYGVPAFAAAVVFPAFAAAPLGLCRVSPKRGYVATDQLAVYVGQST